jgi:hypothetical protein
MIVNKEINSKTHSLLRSLKMFPEICGPIAQLVLLVSSEQQQQ